MQDRSGEQDETLTGVAMQRLQRQITFIKELDALKRVQRQTLLLDKSRRENSAEHSWHLAIMALLLAEHAETAERPLNVMRSVQMLLVHDVVEIDAGDVFLYDDSSAQESKAERETAAANRLFGLLPTDQGDRLRALWEEFEERQSPEAKYAGALDRVQPLIHNHVTEGHTWKQYGITRKQVVERCSHIADGSRVLWAYVLSLLDESVRRGDLAEG